MDRVADTSTLRISLNLRLPKTKFGDHYSSKPVQSTVITYKSYLFTFLYSVQ